MDEILATVTDSVAVDVGGLGEFARHAAIPAVEYLEAVYANTGREGNKWHRLNRVHGFTATGEPLVLDMTDGRLVCAKDHVGRAERFVGVQAAARPPLTAPFAPAPAGLVAVFHDGSRRPVVFYDAYGRAVLLSDTEHRGLYLAEDDDELVHIEGGPSAPLVAEDRPRSGADGIGEP